MAAKPIRIAARVVAVFDAEVEEGLIGRRRRGRLGVDAEHGVEIRVGELQAVVRIEDAEPLAHVGERRIEARLLVGQDGDVGVEPDKAALAGAAAAVLDAAPVREQRLARVRAPVEVGGLDQGLPARVGPDPLAQSLDGQSDRSRCRGQAQELQRPQVGDLHHATAVGEDDPLP